MLENYSSRRGINIPLISPVSRRLVNGHKGEISKIIGDQLNVRITVRAGEKPDQKSYMTIKGLSIPHVAAARDLITQLDQKAKLIADDNILKNTGDVNRLHWDMLKIHLPDLLESAKKKLPTVELEDAPQIIVNPVKPEAPKVKQKPEPVAATEDDGEWKPKPRALTIKFQQAAFVPRNLSQALTYLAAKDITNSYVYAAGPFGGGKTFTPLRAAFESYNESRVDEVIIIRPSASTGRDPGAMPGNARSKMAPYLKGGIESNIDKMTTTRLQELENKKVLRAFTPDFERGETYDHAFILVDEPQNLTIEQAELLIGRLGEGSIMVFAGDIGGNQNDMKKGDFPGLAHLIATQGSGAQNDPILKEATAFIEFKDSDSAARNKILPHVSAALRNPPDEYAKLMQTVRETRRDAAIVKATDMAREFAVRTLQKASEHTLNRYGKEVRANFPSIYEENKEALPQQKPNLKVA